MPFDGTGTFVRLYNWVNDKNNGIPITASRMDNDTNDIVNNGLSDCITRDGQSPPTADLPMGGFKFTGVANGALRTQFPSVGQIQDGSLIFAVALGTADALTAAFTPAAVLSDGIQHNIRASFANATTTPTYAPSGLTAHTITKLGGVALAIGDIYGAGHDLILRYNLANARWELLNPATATSASTILTPALSDGTYYMTRLQKTTTIAQSTTTDIFRFLDLGGNVIGNQIVSGMLTINIVDEAAGANNSTFMYAISTTGNGASNNFSSQFTLPGAAATAVVRGTSLVTTFPLVADGGGGAVKFQLTTAASGKVVTARVSFNGMVK